MATSRGRDGVKAFMRQLPEQIERKLLRGAGRAAVAVVADEARLRANAEETRADISTSVRKRGDVIEGRVFVKPGWGRTLGIWAEYGTDPHFISVADEDRAGRSVRRINELNREAGSLVIGGQFVGKSVFHPGAQAHPFMRPALDAKEGEAVAAAQAFINARVTPRGIIGTDDGGDA